MAGLETVEELRDEIKLTVDYIPEDKLTEALIYLENLLEFNEETKKAIEESMNPENLLGPYYSAEEMMRAVMADDKEDDD